MISIFAIPVVLLLTFCVFLSLKKMFTLLILVIIFAGFFQAILLSAFPIWEFQFFDDAAIFAMGSTVFAQSLFVKKERFDSSNKFLIIVFLLVFIEILRSPIELSSLSQARQVLFPAFLIYSGWKLSRKINFHIVFISVLSLGAVSGFWAIFELLIQHPLIDPLRSNSLQAMADSATLRNGLPSNYYADGIIPGEAWFRPGGPFLNPPTLGFFLGTVVLAATAVKIKWLRYSVIVLSLLVLAATVARAGLLIAALTIAGTWLWFKVGPRITMIVLATLGAVAAWIFSFQGGTASHATGVPEMLWIGITHPLGLGFDVIGYQASNPSKKYDIGESFAGLVIAWLGWLAIIGCSMLAVFLVRKFSTRPINKGAVTILFWGTGFTLAAVFSESASGLSATAVCWILLGYLISGEATRYKYAQIVQFTQDKQLDDVSCVVIHHNNYPEVLFTLQKLLDAGIDPNNLVIVDNSENPTQFKAFKREITRNISIVETSNNGYAAAANHGIRWLRKNKKLKDYVLVSTHETSPDRRAIKVMRDYLFEYPRLGVVGPLLLDSAKSEPTIWSKGGLLSSFLNSPKHSGFGQQLDSDELLQTESCQWVDGSFCLYRSVIFNDMELNERYFLYFEETEFHTKLIRNGWEVACVQEAQVSQSSNGVPGIYWGKNIRIFNDYVWGSDMGPIVSRLLFFRKMLGLYLHKGNKKERADLRRGWNEYTPSIEKRI